LRQRSKPQIGIARLSYAIRMRASYLPKFAVAVLVLAAAVVLLSGQTAQVAAYTCTSHHHHCYSGYSWYYSYDYSGCPYYYSYYYSTYYSSNPYYCSYSYYPYYYSYYYPYYYGYNYNYSYNNAYYYGYPYYYSYYGTPYQYQYKLTVATNPANLATVTGGGTYNQGSSASFSVTQTTVQSSANTRYVFSHWGGDYSGVGSSGTVTVNGATNVVAVYQLQYYLSVQTQPQSAPATQGAGWYNAGDTVTLNGTSQPIGDSSSRIVFQGWNVDGQSNQSGSSLSVSMNAPHSVTANYKQQYYLNVMSDQGVPYGQGWYDAGSTAQISVSTPISTSYGVSIVFNGWQGNVQSNSQSTSVQMNGPMTAIASWRTDSTVLYLTIAAGIIAILVAAGIIAFAVSGRGRSNNPPNPKVTRSELAPETHTTTTTTHTSHPKKKTEEETKQTDSGSS
jgi:Divergent InlB B-repeat domain